MLGIVGSKKGCQLTGLTHVPGGNAPSMTDVKLGPQRHQLWIEETKSRAIAFQDSEWLRR